MTKTKPAAAKPEWATITRARANKILNMVSRSIADVPEDLISYCLVLTGDLRADAASTMTGDKA